MVAHNTPITVSEEHQRLSAVALNDMSESERAEFMATLPACSAIEMVRLCLTWLASEVVNHRQNHDPACNCGWDLAVLSAVDKIRDELLTSAIGLPAESPPIEISPGAFIEVLEDEEDEVTEEEFDATMATGEPVEIVGAAAAEAEEPEGSNEVDEVIRSATQAGTDAQAPHDSPHATDSKHPTP